jgi:outer membrane biosynthesis protein TonB
MRRFALLIVLAACTKAPPDLEPEVVAEPVTNVRIAPAEKPVAPGDCVEARRRAAATPDLPVDRIPSVLVAKPPALEKLPAAARRKDGSAEVKIDVLIDTLGKADMKSFKVVTTSSSLLANNVKSVIGKWTFAPAELAGCKVARIFHFIASAPPRKKG